MAAQRETIRGLAGAVAPGQVASARAVAQEPGLIASATFQPPGAGGIPDVPGPDDANSQEDPTLNKPATVYYFATCLVDLLYPGAGLAGMQLLRREGVEVIFPGDQTCCGQPAFNSGYRDEALAVARAQLGCFSRDIPVVVPSGSCGGMIRQHWPELFAGQPDEQQALAVAARTYELTEFLVDVLRIRLNDLGQPIKVAIHTSCSARREMGVADRIEALVAQLDKVEVLTQQRKAECCGFGGTFAIKQADVSGAMVKDKTDALRATGAARVLSQDCGCLMNIGGAFEKQGNALPTQHIAEFLWERTGGGTQ